ncbi:MAG: sulfatase-like hydrolase/transferase [Opitutales bacterium]|nr:sulfatase-like hydrolase/transferase [Opitutales bacterium]MCH8541775.1 sulfatase-like hydrolase/transferase [Opitutales bacterium]
MSTSSTQPPSRKEKSPSDRPNLLFVFTDEQRADTLNDDGPGPTLPNLRQLRDQSCWMEETYCTQPVCTPSRSSMMTGLYPHATGAYGNNKRLREEVPCLPELLSPEARRDYATGYFGKWHLGDEVFAQHGFDTWVSIEDEYHKHNRPGRDPEARSNYHQFLLDQGFKPDKKNGLFSRDRSSTLPEPFGKPAFLANEVTQWIEGQGAKPWIAYVNFLEPHMPFFGPRTAPHEPGELPPGYDVIPSPKDCLDLRLRSERFFQRGFEWYNLQTEEGWRRMAAAYWGLCELIDYHTGRILKSLEASGQADNTIIVFTSDHGEMMGSHRCLAKGVMQQDSVRVPCLIRLPGQKKGQRVTGPFSQIDLVPTLLELLNQEVPDHLHGCSRAPILGGDAVHLNEDVLIQWNGNPPEERTVDEETPEFLNDIAGSPERVQAATQQNTRTLITADGWRWSRNPELEDHELFHLAEDPLERSNLAQDPSQSDRIRSLDERLNAAMLKVDDPGKPV